MGMAETELAAHAGQRGDIIRTLKEDFTSEMTAVRTLLRALDAQGVSLSPAEINFHLVYLEAQGYIKVWRARDVGKYRKDRAEMVKAEKILFARLLPRGLQLLDGKVPEDPSVIF